MEYNNNRHKQYAIQRFVVGDHVTVLNFDDIEYRKMYDQGYSDCYGIADTVINKYAGNEFIITGVDESWDDSNTAHYYIAFAKDCDRDAVDDDDETEGVTEWAWVDQMLAPFDNTEIEVPDNIDELFDQFGKG